MLKKFILICLTSPFIQPMEENKEPKKIPGQILQTQQSPKEIKEIASILMNLNDEKKLGVPNNQIEIKQKSKCKFCNKSFTTATQLATHIKKNHPMIKFYKCPKQNCKKKYKLKSNLEKHLKTHKNK